MKILLTNDDGIFAKGLAVLWSTVKEIADVTVVAPDRERSATGHGITVDMPLRAELVPFYGDSAWSVNGTPADCVKLGVNCLLEEKPDLIISGINRGSNMGIDVLYSGTVSGALEGIILGFPAIAISAACHSKPNYETAAQFLKKIIPKVLETCVCRSTLLNINVPPIPADEIAGVKITRLGTRKYLNSFEVRTDPRGRKYYWLGEDSMDADEEADTDIAAVNQNMISITPIHVDLTDYRALQELNDIISDLTENQ